MVPGTEYSSPVKEGEQGEEGMTEDREILTPANSAVDILIAKEKHKVESSAIVVDDSHNIANNKLLDKKSADPLISDSSSVEGQYVIPPKVGLSQEIESSSNLEKVASTETSEDKSSILADEKNSSILLKSEDAYSPNESNLITNASEGDIELKSEEVVTPLDTQEVATPEVEVTPNITKEVKLTPSKTLEESLSKKTSLEESVLTPTEQDLTTSGEAAKSPEETSTIKTTQEEVSNVQKTSEEIITSPDDTTPKTTSEEVSLVNSTCEKTTQEDIFSAETILEETNGEILIPRPQTTPEKVPSLKSTSDEVLTPKTSLDEILTSETKKEKTLKEQEDNTSPTSSLDDGISLKSIQNSYESSVINVEDIPKFTSTVVDDTKPSNVKEESFNGPSKDKITDLDHSSSAIIKVNPSINGHHIEVSEIFRLNPSEARSDGTWPCPLCDTSVPSENSYSVHLHQYHANPHLLSVDVVSQFSITNLVTKQKLDELPQSFYRCHECFAIMGTASTLRGHLTKHKQSEQHILHKENDKRRGDNQTDRLNGHNKPRNDKKISKILSHKRKNGLKKIRRTLKKQAESGGCKILKPMRSTRPQRQVAVQHRLSQLETNDHSDEFNSNSENESDLSNRRRTSSSSRPQRECKSRTKTLVAISLAEQDYDKFDLDFGKFKTDVVNKVPASETESFKEATNKSLQQLSERLPDHFKSAVSEDTSTDLKKAVKGMAEITENDEKMASPSENKVKEAKKSKEPKSSKKKLSSLKKTYEAVAQTKAKSPSFNIKDRKKVGHLVNEVVLGKGDYVCLSCGNGFNSYLELVTHKKKCSETNSGMMGAVRRLSDKPKEAKVPPLEHTDELSKYITESVFRVPETTFNNMHGKLNHLKTEDANQFLNNRPNALGLVRMNYSGDWTVKDVWETGGWEPKDDQLSWQSYEVLATLNNDLDTSNEDSRIISTPSPTMTSTEDAKTREDSKTVSGDLPDELGLVRTRNSSGRKKQQQDKSAGLSSPTLQTASALTRKLTSQITDRQRPVISNSQVQRNFLLKLSSLPWAEQRRVKESFDSSLAQKKNKKATDKSFDSVQQFKNPTMPNRLDLKQTGKSIKYSKGRSRHNKEEKVKTDDQEAPKDVSNTLAGEWEIEHTFVCSGCGIEYDDVVEIMHHKWEAHPHCVVTHVFIKHDLQRPPALLFPQVGPSKVIQVKEEPKPKFFSCSKCEEKFDVASDFHAHILLCGGLPLAALSPTKRGRRRKGHGGGLKSTVRMLKKSSSQSDENTPRKKPRPAKDFSKVPLVPTHNRTTRFKETKEKEAKLLKAKEKREKSRKSRGGRILKDKKVDKDVKRVVRNLLDRVEAKQTKKSSEVGENSASSSRVGRRSLPRRGSERFEIKDTQKEVKQSSDEQETPTRRSNRRRSMRKTQDEAQLIPSEITETLNLILDQVMKTVLSTSKKMLHVSAFDDNEIAMIYNHESLIHFGSPIKGSRSSSTEPIDREISVYVDHKPACVGNLSPVKFDPPASRVQKRLQSDLTENLLPRHDLAKRRRVVSRPTSPVHRLRRSIFPLDLKVSVLDRIDAGEIISVVSADLDIPVNVVTKWWQMRSDLRSRIPQSRESNSAESSDDGNKNMLGAGAKAFVKRRLERVKRKATAATDKDLDSYGQDNSSSGEDKSAGSGDSVTQTDKRRKRTKTKEQNLSDVHNDDKSLVKTRPSRRSVSSSESSSSTAQLQSISVSTINKVEPPQPSQLKDVPAKKIFEQGTKSRPRRQSTIGYQLSESPCRQFMPIEVKQEAIQRINDGESQVAVARDLDISVSTISSWWRKKDALLNVESRGNAPGGSTTADDIEDQTIEELVQMEVEQDKTDGMVNDDTSSVEFIDEVPPLGTNVILELATVQPPASDEVKTNCQNLSEIICINEKTSLTPLLQVSDGIPSVDVDHDKRDFSQPEGDQDSNKAAVANNTVVNASDESIAHETAPDKSELIKSMKLAFNVLGNKASQSDVLNIAKEKPPRDSSDISTNISNELESLSKSPSPAISPTVDSKTTSTATTTAVSKSIICTIRKPSPREVNGSQSISKTNVSDDIRTTDKATTAVNTDNQPKKRKSLEFLANSLMKKALVAHTTVSPGDCSPTGQQEGSCGRPYTHTSVITNGLRFVRDNRVGKDDNS